MTLLVSDGPTMADVPTDLAGQPVADATRARSRRRLRGQHHRGSTDEDVDADRVISLAEGTKLRQPKGETVGLDRVEGPEAADHPRRPGRPDPRQDGDRRAHGAEAHPEDEGRATDENIEKGVVIGTEPGAGADDRAGRRGGRRVSRRVRRSSRSPTSAGPTRSTEAIDILRAARPASGRGVRARRGPPVAHRPAGRDRGPAGLNRRPHPPRQGRRTDEILPKCHDSWLVFHPPGRCAGRGDPQPLRRGHRPGFSLSVEPWLST